MNNFIIIVLDGVGVGQLPDASKYGDCGTNTLSNIAKITNGLNLPNLQKAGLGNITEIIGIPAEKNPSASFGKMLEISRGKDSTTGHWELGGIEVDFDFPYYPHGFPDEIIEKFIELNKLKGVLGNKPASGTEIIKELGEEHLKTGFPIVYTSADSVFQIAAHEEVFSLEKQYEICKITRSKIMVGQHSAGRIIARPFIGSPGNFKRTVNRKDFSLDPPSDTILDVLQRSGIKTVAIGKINDLFNYKGIDKGIKTISNDQGIDEIIASAKKYSNSLIFANLVDFDVYYGHRNDPFGFKGALESFDNRLPEILLAIDKTDRIILTSDHGNDPTLISTDHSREYVPIIYFNQENISRNLGTRNTFSDVAQTAANFFGIKNNLKGISF
ncbi:MAG: phosphopentomutase [Ignavibacteria bacterium]|nr:phosphopentomutase [Ignavibacteria bacterium]